MFICGDNELLDLNIDNQWATLFQETIQILCVLSCLFERNLYDQAAHWLFFVGVFYFCYWNKWISPGIFICNNDKVKDPNIDNQWATWSRNNLNGVCLVLSVWTNFLWSSSSLNILIRIQTFLHYWHKLIFWGMFICDDKYRMTGSS
jgi:hypothetical protein